jgi:aminomethyltransferase
MTKKTALYNKHLEAGAKITDFAGYEMPVSYKGIVEEHMAVRHAAGIFDVSHMGEFMVSGPNAKALLEYICSNDISSLRPGKALYAYLPNEKGGIIDDLLVYCLGEENYMAVVNASNIEKDWNWFVKQNEKFGADLKDISDNTSLMAVQCPKATSIVQKLTDADIESMKFYTVQTAKLAGLDDIIIATTGYTGSGGVEIYCENKDAEKVWDAIMEAGKAEGIQAVGLGARDTLRLEMGFCLYGNDIDDTTSPIEAKLAWVTNFDKDFIAKDIILKQKTEGVNRKLSALLIEGKGIARKGYEVYDESGEELLGEVTSGSQSPVLQKPIALAYIKLPYNKLDTHVKVKIRKNFADARIVRLPFYKTGT